MAAGNIKIQANDTRIYTITPEDGAGGNVSLIIPKKGGSLATDVYQSIAASRLLAGEIVVSNTIQTQGMNTTLYTGNGSTQSVVTGIDMQGNGTDYSALIQWSAGTTNAGDVRYFLDSSNRKIRVVCLRNGVTSNPNTLLTFTLATFSDWKIESETFGGLVWNKARSIAANNDFTDTVRGATKTLRSDTTGAELTIANNLTSFNNNGFSVGSNGSINTNLATCASWSYQTTHIISGLTNHGKPYITEYNPVSGYEQTKYEGSGTAGHEIPHHLGRKLGFVTIKNLSAVASWTAQYRENFMLELNTTAAEASGAAAITGLSEAVVAVGTNLIVNTSTNQYILYGWANSFYDDKGLLKGNYEVGTYVGTGVGTFIPTKQKAGLFLCKAISTTGDWCLLDNQRAGSLLYPNLSTAEQGSVHTIGSTGVTLTTNAPNYNASGVTYLYMVAYDTNANGGGTYYPRATDTSNVQLSNAQIMYSDGYANGTAKNTSEVLDGTTTVVPSNGYVAGYNWIKKTSGGAYTSIQYEPKFGEADGFSDCYINGKWYNNTAVFKDDFSDGDVNGWANGTFVSGTIKIVNATQAYQNITLQANKKYRIRFKHKSSNGAYPQVYVNDGTYASIGVVLVSYNTYTLGTISIAKFAEAFVDFKTVSASNVIRLASDSTGDTFSYFDDISIVPINDDGSIDTSSATPLGNITYLPIKVLADASGQVVGSESWKYPEIVAEVMAVSRLPELPKHVANKEYVDGVALGVGQTWQDVTSKRAKNTVYTNSSGKPIQVFIEAATGASSGQFFNAFVGGLNIGWTGGTVSSYSGMTFIVPNGSTYECRDNLAGASITKWTELR